MKDILYGLGAVLLLALMVIWGLALVLAGPALLKFCILYLFGYMRVGAVFLSTLKPSERQRKGCNKWKSQERGKFSTRNTGSRMRALNR